MCQIVESQTFTERYKKPHPGKVGFVASGGNTTMANNRLALVCKECREGAYLGKYYPSLGWYSSMKDDYKEYMDAFLEKHTHGESLWSEHEFVIGYEMDEEDFKWFKKPPMGGIL